MGVIEVGVKCPSSLFPMRTVVLTSLTQLWHRYVRYSDARCFLRSDLVYGYSAGRFSRGLWLIYCRRDCGVVCR